MTNQILYVNFERLKQDITTLSEIGRAEDGGIYRMAFTDADMHARNWLISKIKEAGLQAEIDSAANVFGRLNSRDNKPSVLMGSHIDTVPGSGHLDGALGVLVALECLRRINEEGIHTTYPLEMVSLTDEEGRFGGLFGSQALCGDINPETIHNATDLNGLRLFDAMSQHGMDAMLALEARRPPNSIQAYLELHIEQGPVLDRLGYDIGIVEDITGLFKWSIRLIGEADHAGTTPMNMRKDALMGLAELAGELPRVLEEHGSETSVATIGKVDLTPGTANTVPGRVDFSLDVRDPSQSVLDELANAFRRVISTIGRRRSLMFEFNIISEVKPQQCDDKIVESLTKTSKTLGINAHRMPSGAAHDAQIMAQITRVGMIFVPSVGGRSHSPAEWTHWKDIESGANLALNTLIELAEGKMK